MIYGRALSLAPDTAVPLIPSVVGVVGLGVGVWPGGEEMVYIKGMAVETVEKLAKKVEEKKPHLRFAG